MAREKKQECPPGAPLWLATYGDMMTLVLCFFVLMYSFSTPDMEKLEQFSQAFMSEDNPAVIDFGSMGITEIMGNGIIEFPTASDAQEITEQSDAERERALAGYVGDIEEGLQNAYASPYETYNDFREGTPEVSVNLVGQTMQINLNADAFFAPGSANLAPDMDITALADALTSTHTDGDTIVVEGHTDNVPQGAGRFLDNWELSSARAASMLRALVAATGIPEGSFEIVGRGEYEPVADNDTAEGRAQNRRVVIYVNVASYLEGISNSIDLDAEDLGTVTGDGGSDAP